MRYDFILGVFFLSLFVISVGIGLVNHEFAVQHGLEILLILSLGLNHIRIGNLQEELEEQKKE